MLLYKGFRFAVVGATGNVGRSILQILAERGCPVENVSALASERSSGRELSYGLDHTLPVHSLETFDFSDIDIAFFSAGSKISATYASKVTEQGCIIIDNTSHFRMAPDVPLVVPEVNGHAIAEYTRRGIIANPNCSTIQLLLALKPLHDHAGVRTCIVSTYQSVSGAGKEAMDELYGQTKCVYVNQETEPNVFTKPIAFNVIPHIDAFMEDGSTKEEWKMRVETQKILDERIQLSATCVRVPVFIGHALAVHLSLENCVSVAQAHQIFRDAPGGVLLDDPQTHNYITPLECVGEDAVYVSRVRQDPSLDHGLALWIVSDNIRKGAALNSVQIAETLIQDHLAFKLA